MDDKAELKVGIRVVLSVTLLIHIVDRRYVPS